MTFGLDRKQVDHFDSQSPKTSYLNYKKKLWDGFLNKKLEEGIVINFEKVPKEVHSLLLYISIEDVTKRQVNPSFFRFCFLNFYFNFKKLYLNLFKYDFI